MGSKSIEAQFRDQAELIDRRFDEGFRAQAELDRRFLLVDQRLDRIATDVSALKKDMTIVRDGIGILLKRDGRL